MKTFAIVTLLASFQSSAADCYESLPAIGEAKTAVSSNCLAPKPFKVIGGDVMNISPFSNEIEIGSGDKPKNMFTQYIDSWHLVKPAKETEEWKDRLKSVAEKNGFVAAIENTQKLMESAQVKYVKTRMEFDQVVQRRCLLFTASSVCANVPLNQLVSCQGKAHEIVNRVSDGKSLSASQQGEIILDVLQSMGYKELSSKVSAKGLAMVRKYIPYVGKGVDYAYKAKDFWGQFQQARQLAEDTNQAKESGADDVTWAKAFDKVMKDRESEHFCYPGEKQFRKKVEFVLGHVKGQVKKEMSKKDKASGSSSNTTGGDEADSLLPFGIGTGKKAD